jgi:hypothetical protein
MGIPHHSAYGTPQQVGSAAVFAYGPFEIKKQGDRWIVRYANYTDLVEPQSSLNDAVRGATALAALFESKYKDAGSTWRRLIVPFTHPSTSDRRRLVDASKMFFSREQPALQLLAVGFALARLQHENELTQTLHDGNTYRLEVFPATGVIKEPSNPKYGAVYIPTISSRPGDGMYHDMYRISRVNRNNSMRYNRHVQPKSPASTGARRFDPKALALGTQHEMEHTDDVLVARKIAQDHLAHYPHYYEMLEEMEREYPRRYPQDVVRANRASRDFEFVDSQYDEFPRDIAEQVRELRANLWAKHGTGGNPPTRWTGDDAYQAWAWWIDLREGRTPPSSDQSIAKAAYTKLTGEPWSGPTSELFPTVVALWLRKRENYVSRHRNDFRPGGTISMIKWAAEFPATEGSPARDYNDMLETLGLYVAEDGTVSEF